MVSIILIDIRVQGTGIYEKRYRRTSLRKISSMRSDVVLRPLRPALEANSRRPFPPRWVSIASRVRSETVVPRRAASWRSRASRSSGSFTVVLFMVCQHTMERPVQVLVRAPGDQVGVEAD